MSLHRLINHARILADLPIHQDLSEAVERSADAQHLLNAAQYWRKVVKQGDNLLEAVQGVVDGLETAEAEEFPQRRHGALVDVRKAVEDVQVQGKAVYSDFALGREEFYQAAKLWGLSTRRSGKGAAKKPSDLSAVEDAKLVSQASMGSKNLISATGAMLEAGAKATNMMTKCAKVGCTEEERPAVLTAGLDFRDLVSEAMFSRVNGVMRRAGLAMERFSAQQESRGISESKEWHAPWENDPEIGDNEVL
jgi:hypothetical protein